MSSFSFFIFLLCFCFIILSFSPCFYFSLPVRFYPLISFICSWSPSLIRFLTHCRSPFSLALVSNQLKMAPKKSNPSSSSRKASKQTVKSRKPPSSNYPSMTKAVRNCLFTLQKRLSPTDMSCLMTLAETPVSICLISKTWKIFFFANHWSCLSKLGPLLSLQPFMFRRKYFDLFCQWRRNHYW